MNEPRDKTPEQITDEDFKVAPTSSDKKVIDKLRSKEIETGENYELPSASSDERE